jgi:Flp pilus assembly protein TadG
MLEAAPKTDTAAAPKQQRKTTAVGGVSIAGLAARWRRDEKGHVAVTFGLMVVPCMMLLGCAVDLGRMLHAKTQMQGVMDNLALTVGRAVQNAPTGSNYLSVAQSAANQYWAAVKDNVTLVVPSSGGVKVVAKDAAQTNFNVSADVWVATPFMTAVTVLDAFHGRT